MVPVTQHFGAVASHMRVRVSLAARAIEIARVVHHRGAALKALQRVTPSSM
jgi:hypothetical protein